MIKTTYVLQKGASKASTVSRHRFERARKSSAWYGARVTRIDARNGHTLLVLVHSDIMVVETATEHTLHDDATQDGQNKRKRPNGKKKAQSHLRPHSHVGKFASMTKTETTPRSGLHYERKRA